jgi:hypothetical protein
MALTILCNLLLFGYVLYLQRKYNNEFKHTYSLIQQEKTIAKNSRREIKRNLANLKESQIAIHKDTDDVISKLSDRISDVRTHARVGISEKGLDIEKLEERLKLEIEDVEFEVFKLSNPITEKTKFIDEDGDEFIVRPREKGVAVYKEGETIIEVNEDAFYADWFRGDIAICE